MEYTPNQELEKLKKEKEENEKKVEQLDHRIQRLENRIKYYKDADLQKAPPTVFALLQELWKASHRQSKTWRSPR